MIEVANWVVLNFFTSFLLILLLVFQSRTSRLQKGKRYSAILICTLILIFSESIGKIGELHPDNFLFLAKIGYFLIFLLDPVDILFAIFYIDCWMDEDNYSNRKFFINAFKIFAVINVVLVTIAQLFDTHWFFFFKDGIYYRGPLFMQRAVMLMIFIILLVVYALVYRKDIMSDYKNTVMALPVLSFIGSVLQVVFINMDTTYAGISLGCLIVFFFFQSKDVNIDYLTGVLNRRGLDIKLEETIKNSASNGKNFYALMIDIDYFKEINDNYGHEAGDKAIKAVAGLLVDVFGQSTSSIGRFGGDEFCVIINDCSYRFIQDRLKELNAGMKRLRKRYNWPDHIDISCGYQEYESDSQMSLNEFQQLIDELMYIEKERHHNA